MKNLLLLLLILGFFMLIGCSHKETPTSVVHELEFGYTAQNIRDLCQQQQTLLIQSIDEIAKTPKEQILFENALGKLERVSAEFGNITNPLIFLKYVSSDEAVIAAAEECEKAVEKLFVDIFVREDLFAAIKAVQEKNLAKTEKDVLLLDEYLRDFQRNGLELPPEQRKIFVDKKKILVEEESNFSTELNKWQDHLAVTKQELDGLDEAFISSLEKTPDGKYKITMAYPHYYTFMENAKNADARKRLEFKFSKRGGPKNVERLEKAVRLRHELANMLGRHTHADFILERRMAKDPKTVLAFLNDLAVKLRPKGKRNLEELLELKRAELNDPSINSIQSHDWRYYERLLKEKKHQVDTQLIKEYFPLQVVLPGMFEIFETLFEVKFVVDTAGKKWHESVEHYLVQENGQTIGILYLDLFPRKNKYGHAAAFTLLSGYELENGTYLAPISAIVANFNPPTPENPSLLAHDQVETLFHELGHIMHQVLTKARYATFSGTRVKRDYVEAPSQILENWCWEKESLAKMSGHYKDTSKPLPDEQIQKLIDAKLVNVGIRYLRQIMFGILDMTYHTSETVNSTEVYRKLAQEIMLIPIPDKTIPQASFGHLMGGYDAGYYGYLWSEVYAADMFTRFEKEGLLNPQTGREYRQWILAPGGEKEPMELIRGFLGREPNSDAFLKSIGL